MHWLHNETKIAHGQAYADALGRWLEGLVTPGMDQAMYDFLAGNHTFFFAGKNIKVGPGTDQPDIWGAFGDRGTDPAGDASPADLIANRSGQTFWENINSGTFDSTKFNICDYINKDWDQTKNPNIKQDPKPSRPPASTP